MAELVDEQKVLKHKTAYQKGIAEAEKRIAELPNSFVGGSKDDICPLNHTFVDGMYVREIFMPKGLIITSKIHKYKHPYFVMSGDVSVLTDKGIIRIKAPFSGITERGTKRLLYIHEDTIWITVHATQSKDLSEVEDEIIAKTFNDVVFDKEQIDSFYQDILKLKEE